MEPVWALGAMSGTSLDGVDAALLRTDGIEVLGFGPSAYRPYKPREREAIRGALGRWEGPSVVAAGRVVDRAHAEALRGLDGAEVVGYHGQTLAHDPQGRGTLQVGDGAWLAGRLGLPVVWDFRSADVRMGGEGAPLAPFYHWALARRLGARGPLAVLNLGGVGNLTWVDPDAPRPEAPGALLAFDTGPANAPLDDLVRRRLGRARDEGGALAASGAVAQGVVEEFLAHPYLDRPPPKSLDRDDFAWLGDRVAPLGDADAAATLAACAAAGVLRAAAWCPRPPGRLLVAGGGRRNATLLAMVAAAVDCPALPVEEVGLDGDMLEAQAFAFLAVRVLRGLPTSAPGTTGVAAAVGGGQVSRPVPLPVSRTRRRSAARRRGA